MWTKISRLESFTGLDTLPGVMRTILDRFKDLHRDIPAYQGIMAESTARYIRRAERDHISRMLGGLEGETQLVQKIYAMYMRAQKREANCLRNQCVEYRAGLMEVVSRIDSTAATHARKAPVEERKEGPALSVEKQKPIFRGPVQSVKRPAANFQAMFLPVPEGYYSRSPLSYCADDAKRPGPFPLAPWTIPAMVSS
ncbi:MAG: hypothetical protein P4L51_04610 [Puia sp.]|nr:hypothetical protein [Puia sp.]